MRIKKASGFTLIELLTVIAIVGILAAIIIPTVGRVRASAKAAQSKSNLRQIGMATLGYLNENKGIFPCANFLVVNGVPNRFWCDALEVYVLASADPIRKSDIFSDPTAENKHGISDYGASFYVFQDTNNPLAPAKQVNIINIQNPSRIAIVTTAWRPSADAASWYMSPAYVTGGPSQVDQPHARYPGGQVGVLFADAHVESIPGTKVFEDRVKLFKFE
jgi:prepilin-type N-terminal cleavage/methylation domain-containing protein/prepilin-type processing-associated H-X9-DG protein